MRLGVFGGSFDPVHFGHLLLAETCREKCHLDFVWFVPAAQAPHKKRGCIASAQERLEMLELAVSGHQQLSVSTIEIDRGGVSYTVDTLAQIAGERSNDQLFFLMGADSLKELPTWRNPEEICQLAVPMVARRKGSQVPDLHAVAPFVSAARLEEIRLTQFETEIIELSSTDIRRRVFENRSIRFRTPRAVEQYVLANGLYRQAGDS